MLLQLGEAAAVHSVSLIISVVVFLQDVEVGVLMLYELGEAAAANTLPHVCLLFLLSPHRM